MATEPDQAARWDDAYAQGDAARSWFQAAPRMSLRLIDAAGVTAEDSRPAWAHALARHSLNIP